MKVLVALALTGMFLGCGGGAPGRDGVNGRDGANGITMLSNTFCTGFWDPTNSGYGFTVQHEMFDFSDGSVLATCEVQGGNTQTSSVSMYRATQVGAAKGLCNVLFDVESNNTSGYFSFEEGLATYKDSGSGYNLRTAQLACTTYQ